MNSCDRVHLSSFVIACSVAMVGLLGGCAAPVAPLVKETSAAPKRAKALSPVEAKLNAGVRSPIAYKTREDGVKVMVEAFSLSNNAGMRRVSESIKAMGTALAGLQDMVGVAGGGLQTASLQAYGLMGVKEFRQGEAVLLYDEKSRELSSIRGQDVDLQFSFSNKGELRSWGSEIVKSPDGTTGSLSLEASSRVWRPYEIPSPSAPWICGPSVQAEEVSPVSLMNKSRGLLQEDEGSDEKESEAEPIGDALPIATRPPGLGDLSGMDEAPAREETEDFVQPDDDFCGPDPLWVAPEPVPFVVAGGEYPEYLETLNFRFSLVPRGDQSLAFQLTATLDEPGNVPNTGWRIPTRWKLQAQVPGLAFNWESSLNLIPNNSFFEGQGKMIVEVSGGQEQFNYGLTFREATRASTFSMTNLGAKMKLLITSDYGSPPHTRLLSTEAGNDLEIGTVEMKPGSSNVALVRFNDGKRIEWELFPTGLFGVNPAVSLSN